MKVQVSMWPDRDLEVDDSEYAELYAHGLLPSKAKAPALEISDVPADAAGVAN